MKKLLLLLLCAVMLLSAVGCASDGSVTITTATTTTTTTTNVNEERLDIATILKENDIEKINIIYGRSPLQEPQTIEDKEKISEIIELFSDNVRVYSDEETVSSFRIHHLGAYPTYFLCLTFLTKAENEISFVIYGETAMMLSMGDSKWYVCYTNFSKNYELLKEILNWKGIYI